MDDAIICSFYSVKEQRIFNKQWDIKILHWVYAALRKWLCPFMKQPDIKENALTHHSLWLDSPGRDFAIDKFEKRFVAMSAISNNFKILNVLTTIHSFSSKQWMTQRPSVYELSSWHITQLICVKRVKNSWMTISSVKSLSYYYSCQEQLSPFLVKTSESLLMSIVI